MNGMEKYFDNLRTVIDSVQSTQFGNMEQAAQLMLSDLLPNASA